MAEEADEEAAAAAAKAKKKKMIGGLLIAGLAYQFVLKGSPPPEDPAAAEAAAAEALLEEGVVAPIPELVVNLADTDSVHYLRVGVGAVLQADVDPAAFETELPKVSDVVIEVASTKTFAELREPGATSKLKDEISAAVHETFEDGEVVRVIFTTFVMQ